MVTRRKQNRAQQTAQITACDNILQVQAIKARYGEDTIRQAWRMLPAESRRRLKEICDTQPAEAVQDTRASDATVNSQPSEPINQTGERVESTDSSKRSLFEIGVDMHQSADELETALDATEDPDEQAQLIDLWLQQNAGFPGRTGV